ncbi:hypothetical protein L6452_09148 [Arctium lappa]|uniref:Uncharacterized protein n=1 Tax=Arctium lappa TaxID=4217 RepID=A0ACB9DJ64_ARCLA|nr:hypothetical protein L6452_09148 [Arctium lappa]
MRQTFLTFSTSPPIFKSIAPLTTLITTLSKKEKGQMGSACCDCLWALSLLFPNQKISDVRGQDESQTLG